ncbi:tyrosine-protein kinase Wzc [Serratia fonticola]|uniref:tyrosine-protein kinase Wzc n=1 Tax=Serratia fonticola TaxID=47917 RepID=UPI00217B4C87|nr:tyrosine-protein kinase Wzc [Serratia fonticola]CAI1665356.1 Putative tyrosine-protein kinase in cps region [Serratia fonticola]
MSEKNKSTTLRNDNSDDIDLGRLLGELVDNRWLIIAVTTATLVVGVIYSLLATPIYRADAMVQVEQNVGNSLLSNLNQMLPSSQLESAPEIELIKSRMILSQTVDDLNLNTIIKQKYIPIIGRGWARIFSEQPGQIAISKLGVPASWSEKKIIITVGDDNSYKVSRGNKEISTGKVGVLFEKDGVQVLVSDIDAPVGTEFVVEQQSLQTTIKQLLDRLDVSDKGKNTGVLSLGLTGDDPVLIQKTLDSITRNYLEQNVARKSEEDAKSLVFLREQLPKVRQSLDFAEEKLNLYRQQKDSVDLSLEAKSVLDTIVAVESQINELTFKEADISKLYTKEHPAYKSLLEKRKTLEDEKERLSKRVNTMPKTQQEILRLSRDVQSGQVVYMQLLNREQELSISKASTVGNVRIIDKAVTQDEPVEPKKIVIILLSFIIGTVTSIGFVIGRALLHRGIESPEQLEELGINVYASIPLSEWQRRKDLEFALKNKKKKKNADTDTLLAVGNPADLAIEAIRSLRTSLHFAMMEAKNNILMISGASPGIGKTFVSANLAAVVAQAGTRVLFIDSDMRKGYVHEIMGLDLSNGLSDILAGKVSVEQAVQKAGDGGFDFISRGQIPPNPSELLMHTRFSELLDWASKNYDLVLIDTPPILAVTDAAIIGKSVGAAMLVARFEVNSPKEVDVSIRRFEQNGIEIKGVILNAVTRKASNYYSYGYDYYDYKYEAKEDN